MTADKKKVTIISLLGVCLVGVGAFQFLSGGAEKPAPSKPKPSHTSLENPENGTGLIMAENNGFDPYNEAFKFPVNQHDPFRPQPTSLMNPNVPKNPTGPIPRPPTPKGPTQPWIPPVTPNVGIQPGTPLQTDFPYTLSGIILGSRPAAVFTDESGNQRLVQIGGSLDPDCKVISVGKGKVVIVRLGVTHTLSLGGNP
jgi:hypothetical protein